MIDFKNRICMSQAGSISGGGGPVGPAIETLTGNSGGPVSPIANNVNVVFDQQASTIPPTGFTAIGNLVAGTLTFEQFLYSAVTVGATSSTLITIPLAANQMIIAVCDVLTTRNDYVNGAGNSGVLVARSTSGTITVLSESFGLIGDNSVDTDFGVFMGVAGSNVTIFVTSALAGTYNWSAYIRYHLQ